MKTVYVILAFGLMMYTMAFAEIQENATLPYSTLCRIASLNMNGVAGLTNQEIRLTAKSTLPGVRAKDIRLYIDSRSGQIPILLNADGTFSLPISEALLMENPNIVANQPKGSMELNATFDLHGTLPESTQEKRSGRMRYNALFFMEEVRNHLSTAVFGELPVSNALSKTIIAVALIPQKDADTASVVVESTNRPFVIKRSADGIFWLRRDKDLTTENPWVIMPTNHQWKIMSQLHEKACGDDMMKTTLRNRGFLECALATTNALSILINEPVNFDLSNSRVNQEIIQAYKAQPSAWSEVNLFRVGLCCVTEKQYGEAKAIFSRLTNEVPTNTQYTRAYANAVYLNGDYADALGVFSTLWKTKQDVGALKGLGLIAVQEKDVTTLRNLVPDLEQHKAVDLDVRKVLLLYSLMEEDMKKGGPVYVAAVRGLKKSEVRENAEFRKVLILATMKYKDAAEQTNSPHSSPSAGSKR